MMSTPFQRSPGICRIREALRSLREARWKQKEVSDAIRRLTALICRFENLPQLETEYL